MITNPNVNQGAIRPPCPRCMTDPWSPRTVAEVTAKVLRVRDARSPEALVLHLTDLLRTSLADNRMTPPGIITRVLGVRVCLEG